MKTNFTTSDYLKRRQLEIKRRVGVLHYRRDRLERELKAIKSALFSLDQQMQRDSSCKQLTI